jgi:hypothetical protein
MIKQLTRLTLLAGLALAQAAADPVESDYYKIDAFPVPDGIVMETSGIEMMPDGKLAICSRRGDIYMLSNLTATPPRSSGACTPRACTSLSTSSSTTAGSTAPSAAS